ncbi:hypothetical protein EXU57_15830 [Segetibacter sp. 3557_3]|uniref:hypothetical protein n=1 Tax=Segetibacter sp. 3557_3 TaxID=2547429 RepID=UPI0010589DFD|nr:hypothetical protein [Segetibacter sp. 3557_3]TDH23962.1 hypothetical protein EXU57_15830 [Segetibacter sp. 3557_3]
MDLKFFDFTDSGYYPKVLLTDIEPDMRFKEDIISKPGKSETFFEYKLNQYFNKYLIRDIEKDNYKPDFVIASKKEGYIIDIEVDEPYAFKQAKPIHFTGKDDKRDSFFANAGWDVIRFSENQVINYPNGCCKVISYLIYHKTQNHIWLDGFENIPFPETEECWDHERSKYLAQIGYRDEYLKFLKPALTGNADASILIDGIYLAQATRDTKQLYQRIHGEEYGKGKFENLILELKKYLPNLIQTDGQKLRIKVIVFISIYHELTNFDFDIDFLQLDNYEFDFCFVKTDEIICFEIGDFVNSNPHVPFILMSDDPAYISFIKGWEKDRLNFILCRNNPNTFLPGHLRYIDSSYPCGRAIGVKEL